MKKFLQGMVLLIILLLCSKFWISCSESNSSRKRISPRIKHMSKVTQPRNGSTFTSGDTLNIGVQAVQDTVEIASIDLTYGFQKIGTWESGTFDLLTDGLKAGNQRVTISVAFKNGKTEKHSLSFKLLAADDPVQYTYRVLNTFDHDPKAYTQGLLFDNGNIIESTGHQGESFLRRWDPNSGNTIKHYDLDSRYFGEGIAMIGQKIFMLTWKSNIGFIFDRNDFSQLGTFNYPTEGWGLTAIGDTLVRSDGTEYLYFLNPETFDQISKLQVYDNRGAVSKLNELEYFNGSIYANIYETDDIAIIDPKTGFVTGRIGLNNIFDKRNYSGRTDVLNGIAFDNEGKRLYVTGKWWPNLYEIDIYPVSQTIN